MKIVKLFFTFLVILAVVVGLLFLKWGDKGDSSINKTVGISFEVQSDKIKSYWEDFTKWEERKYIYYHIMAAQSSTDLGKDKSDLLVEINSECAIKNVQEYIIKEWKSPTCKPDVIRIYINAISTIEQYYPNAEHNEDVKKIRAINELYKEARNLATKNLGKKPDFKDIRWEPYSKYEDNIKRQRDNIKKDSNYSYICNIKEINDGLNGIESKLKKGKDRFYNDLSEQIVDYYGKIEAEKRNKNQLNNLRTFASIIKSEYGKIPDVLNDFITKFDNDVEENQN